MKALVFPGSREKYLAQSKSWGESVAVEIEQVEELMKHCYFGYHACGNQEVYYIKDEGLGLYEVLKPKLKSLLMSQDKTQYQMARSVTAW